MRSLRIPTQFVLTALILTLAVASSNVHAQRSTENVVLLGANENPPLASPGFGSFSVHIPTIGNPSFTMFYFFLPSPVTAAHIHLGNPGTNGPVAVTLCSSAGDAPERPCPENGAPLVAAILPSDVQEVRDGDRVLLAAEDVDGLTGLIIEGATYVNVHTEDHPPGELRGQINERER